VNKIDKIIPEFDISDMNKMRLMSESITNDVKTLGIEKGNIKQDQY